VNTLGRKKPRFGCPGQVNFALGQVKMEVWWASGQVFKIYLSQYSNVSDNFQLKQFQNLRLQDEQNNEL